MATPGINSLVQLNIACSSVAGQANLPTCSKLPGRVFPATQPPPTTGGGAARLVATPPLRPQRAAVAGGAARLPLSAVRAEPGCGRHAIGHGAAACSRSRAAQLCASDVRMEWQLERRPSDSNGI